MQNEEQSNTPMNKIKYFLLDFIKKISDFKVFVRITELILSLLFTFIYGRKPLVSW
jgi:hypothetical protein